MRRSLSIGGSFSVQWRKVGRSWRLRMCFRRLLCVRIEIDQLQCVNCWVIIHCLSVSCTKINHSRCALVIWSSLQLTSKQWIITQQFTARADLFLKQPSIHLYREVIYLIDLQNTIWIIENKIHVGIYIRIYVCLSLRCNYVSKRNILISLGRLSRRFGRIDRKYVQHAHIITARVWNYTCMY